MRTAVLKGSDDAYGRLLNVTAVAVVGLPH